MLRLVDLNLDSFKQGLWAWLCQAVGAVAPSGGRKRHEVRDLGGE